MLKSVLLATILTFPIAAQAASTFVVVLHDYGTGNSTPLDWAPLSVNPWNGGYQRIDLRGVNQFRFVSEGYRVSADDNAQITLQISLDNGITWGCLGGTAECLVGNVLSYGGGQPAPGTYIHVVPTNITTIPSSQRQKNAIIRTAVRSESGTGSVNIFNFTAQFYRQ
jgi:hypothetical protein